MSRLRVCVENLACARGGRRLFEAVSFTLDAGDALMVAGRNGAGKSSLLDILCGRLAPVAGSIALTGEGDAPLEERLHYVGHRDALKSALTAGENLLFAQGFLGDPALSPGAALSALGLAHAEHLPVAYLSAGQRRRVALARLLVARRPLWLLDEPTAALDSASQDVLRALIEAHRMSGGIVVATTHAPLFLKNARELTIARRPAQESLS